MGKPLLVLENSLQIYRLFHFVFCKYPVKLISLSCSLFIPQVTERGSELRRIVYPGLPRTGADEGQAGTNEVLAVVENEHSERR